MLNRLKALWRVVRRLSGDDAYERYLRHHAEQHVEAFFKQWQDGKWKGVKRCC